MVTIDAVYQLVLSVRDEVKALQPLVASVGDHETRLRELEAHGSPNAQDMEREMGRTRERLHAIEGTQGVQTAAINENAASIASIRSTLVKLAFLTIAAVFTALGTLVVYLIVAP